MRLAIFGGTFDPVHTAHLAIAREAAKACGLDRVLMIPNAIPPHKQVRLGASYEHRLAMVRLACSGDPVLEPSDLESAAVTSYSVETIRRVRETLAPGARLFFIIGADAFAEIGTWYRWAEVIAAVEFIVVTRPGHRYAVPQGTRLHELQTLQLDVSSSRIREQLAVGETPQELPAPVLRYIREHGLYST